MSVGRICTRKIDTAGPGETAVDVARRMREQRVGTVVVVDDAAHPMGLITDRDLALRVVAAGREATRTPAIEIMSPMPTAVLEDTSIESALGHMRVGRMRRLPVINGAGALVGIVTLDDILALLAEEFSLIGGLLAREAPHQLPGES
jgi:CBS domain-containing protein